MFDEKRCDFCGDCLVSCAYVDYSREKAIEEMRALVTSGEAGVLRDCITCMACNEYCEKGANPFDLISNLQERGGAISVFPQTMAMFEQLAASPSSILQRNPAKPALSLCTIEPFLRPDIMQSEIFKDMTLVRGGDYFCHYAMLHVGKAGMLSDRDRAFIQNLSRVNAEEIVFLHEECYIMATKMAKEFGLTVPFKATSLLEYINRYLKENLTRIRPIGKRIAYQRPCSSRAIPETEGLLKEFFELIGVERINRKYDGKDALCCGAAIMGLGRFNSGKDVIARNMEDILSCRPDALAYLCPFCGYTLAEPLRIHHLPAIFIADLAAMALGEIPFPGAT
jgi:Fe-S oxidoreductase